MEYVVCCTPYIKNIGLIWSYCNETRFKIEDEAKDYLKKFIDTETIKYIKNIRLVKKEFDFYYGSTFLKSLKLDRLEMKCQSMIEENNL